MPEQHDKPSRRRRDPAVVAAEHAPYIPIKWENADVMSMQRLRAGAANPIEQQRALDWILRCTGLTDEPYRPGHEAGRRDTDFALGKAHVGRQIAKLLNLDLSRIRGGNNEQP